MTFGAKLCNYLQRENRITENTASRHGQNKAIEGRFFEQTVSVKCPKWNSN